MLLFQDLVLWLMETDQVKAFRPCRNEQRSISQEWLCFFAAWHPSIVLLLSQDWSLLPSCAILAGQPSGSSPLIRSSPPDVAALQKTAASHEHPQLLTGTAAFQGTTATGEGSQAKSAILCAQECSAASLHATAPCLWHPSWLGWMPGRGQRRAICWEVSLCPCPALKPADYRLTRC